MKKRKERGKKVEKVGQSSTLFSLKVSEYSLVVHQNLQLIVKLSNQEVQELQEEVQKILKNYKNQKEQIWKMDLGQKNQNNEDEQEIKRGPQIYLTLQKQNLFIEKYKELITEIQEKGELYYEIYKKYSRALSNYNGEFVNLRTTFNKEFKLIRRYINGVFKSLTSGGELLLEKINDNAYDLQGITFTTRFPFCPVCETQYLSGGQKTLIGLAIILGLNRYKPSSLVLLDEADSHLDSNNARVLSRYLRREMGVQKVVISHRVETLEFGEEFVLLQACEAESGGISAKHYKYEEVVNGDVRSVFLNIRGEAMQEEARERRLEQRMERGEGGEMEMIKEEGENRLAEWNEKQSQGNVWFRLKRQNGEVELINLREIENSLRVKQIEKIRQSRKSKILKREKKKEQKERRSVEKASSLMMDIEEE